ncbi:ferredoxin reductase [Streptomyces sp. NPDC055692]|uniref:ferredoxin reductase n=1 Tax=Streptomyces sp. NPDC055692 TaxID=3155683 RepID=UPI0034459B37
MVGVFRHLARPMWRGVGRLTTPLLPDDFLAVVDPLWSSRWPMGRVEAVQPETADATTLVVRAGRGWAAHRAAGQYVPVGVGIDGVLHWRTYSITTPPDGTGRFSITVRAVPGGRVSSYLAHGARPGETLRVGPAQGAFVLPDPMPARLLFLTGGIGIIPAMSMLRALAGRAGRRPDTVLVHCAPDADQVVFGRELQDMAAHESWFTLHEQHTRTEERLHPARLDRLCADWPERDTWACGPESLLAFAERVWRDADARDRLRLERFRPPSPAVPSDGPGITGGRVRFTRSGVEADADPTTPLLDIGEAAGVAMPSGCRVGICHSCVSPLSAGRVRDLRTGDVHGEPGDLIQTCVSAACGPVHINL